ncbi:hypothetical protein WJX84_005581 [Apatococcus fuscideae]|uniref:Cytosol aminopeptidase domain-containing protein n=1 Tax=Apatococcus fuscideae TaxID=2026836 RepID=A0AAW1SWY9_9CHLO
MLNASNGLQRLTRVACTCGRFRARPDHQIRKIPVCLSRAPSFAELSKLDRALRAAPLCTRKFSSTRCGQTARAAMIDFPLASSAEGIQFPELPEITTSSADATSWKGDLLLIGVFEDDLHTPDGAATEFLDPGLLEWSKATEGLLAEIVAENEFKGKLGSKATVRWSSGAAKYIGVVGLGERSKATLVTNWGPSCFQAAGGQIAAEAKVLKAVSAAFIIGGNDTSLPDGSKDGMAAKVAAGVLLGAYEATRFKKDAKLSKLRKVEMLGGSGSTGLSEAVSLAKGTLLCRYVLEMPANIATPTLLANTAESIAAGSEGSISAKILEEDECRKMGMGLYLGVSECSAEPPKFIHLTYKPKGGSAKRKVALVGKGLTFDSGGYNLKVNGGIEMMKFDKGGACAVLGAAYGISQIQPTDVEVHFIIAACENMIDGRGMRPGDILTAMNGLTVEITNTDAEGRLTLGDALLYAQQQDITEVVDIATLTGACMVALGQKVAGVFTPSETVATSLKSASQAAGEKVWRMPMEESYWEDMKSPIADMRNAGTIRYGGAITAALFLKQYIDPKKVQWAHVDIAGPAWDTKEGGAVGFGARTLALWAMGKHA